MKITKEKLEHALVLAVLAALLSWALYEVFKSRGNAPASDQSPEIYSPGNAPDINIVQPVIGDRSPYSAPASSGCGCGPAPGCPQSSSGTNQTVAQMTSMAQNYINIINSAGTNTLQALADIANQNDPLLKVTVG